MGPEGGSEAAPAAAELSPRRSWGLDRAGRGGASTQTAGSAPRQLAAGPLPLPDHPPPAHAEEVVVAAEGEGELGAGGEVAVAEQEKVEQEASGQEEDGGAAEGGRGRGRGTLVLQVGAPVLGRGRAGRAVAPRAAGRGYS